MGITETLIGIDKAGKLAPQLATDWSVSDDKTVWTLTLRENVEFSDSEALTVDAVINSLKMARTCHQSDSIGAPSTSCYLVQAIGGCV